MKNSPEARPPPRNKEKGYEGLARNAQEEVNALKMQIVTLDDERKEAESRSRGLQEQLKTSEIRGVRIKVSYLSDSKDKADDLITHLKSLGARVRSDRDNKLTIRKKHRHKNTIYHKAAPEPGEEQVIEVAKSMFKFDSISDQVRPGKYSVVILLYK